MLVRNNKGLWTVDNVAKEIDNYNEYFTFSVEHFD